VGRRVDLDKGAHGRQGSAPRERLTSRGNPQIKTIRGLASRRERDRSGLFFVEGIRAVAEALERGVEVERLVVAPELLESDFARRLVDDAAGHGVAVLEVSEGVFEALSRKEGPQGLALVGRQRWRELQEVRVGPDDVWVALDAPQDPGNVGTILRTCDATGVAGLILVGPSADPYDPTALRASTGAAFTIGLARTSWREFAAWVEREGVPMIGAAGGAEIGHREAAYPRRLVLLMGSEREGLSAQQQAACTTVVSIPMLGRVDSLNLAVATGVILYEIVARRQMARA